MFLKKYGLILYLYIVAFISYIIHKGVFFILKIQDQNFYFSLEILYLIFLFFSTLLLIGLLIIRKNKFDSVGMLFMLGTFVQMFLYYGFLRLILANNIQNLPVEKNNFFLTFLLFLLFQTILTARLLNEKP
ncbi:hypothetical protein SAMN05216297_101276 [Flavobacterium phragmitis]|uniref:Uncharacterized protein n=1 Tax=Flavobacterium phragmitis TaxID=739143 RepID=A0A1I1K7D7_9FLAO|nr:hypothetical protein SAMN05216297_101276 [Flavobacterium phragmitis]